MVLIRYILICVLLNFCMIDQSQAQLKWESLNQLDSIYPLNEKPFLIYIYADWCKLCKSQEQGVFSDHSIANRMNNTFVNLKLNAESKKPINFLGREYNGAKTSDYHELSAYLSGKENGVVLPSLFIFDSKMNFLFKKIGLISQKELIELMEQFNQLDEN